MNVCVPDFVCIFLPSCSPSPHHIPASTFPLADCAGVQVYICWLVLFQQTTRYPMVMTGPGGVIEPQARCNQGADRQFTED